MDTAHEGETREGKMLESLSAKTDGLNATAEKEKYHSYTLLLW